MSCPAIDRLAAAASGEDAAATEHALVCVQCRDLIVEQQAMILAVRQSPGFVLDPARRRAIAAELATRSDEPMTARSPRFAIAVSVACAAALGLVIAASTTRRAAEPPARAREVATIQSGESSDSSAPSTPPGAASPRAPAPAADAPIDPRAVLVIALAQHVAEAPALVTRATRIDVFDLARAFAPSKPAAAHAAVESEDLYVAPPPDQDAVSIVDDPDPPAPIDAGTSSSSSASLAAFRTGWEALRADRYADAIAAFDTATDPVVAEDAAFWAAIAAERAHDDAAAARRLRGFLARFPNSPRADAARAALARIGHP